MSQSDYLKYKKTSRILNKQTDLDNVLSAKTYTEFKTFILANTMEEKNPTFRQEKIQSEISNCANFILCAGTDQRPNRNNGTKTVVIDSTGNASNNEYMVHQKVNGLIDHCDMFKKCDDFLDVRRNTYRKAMEFH
jgi:hypothetical protein